LAVVASAAMDFVEVVLVVVVLAPFKGEKLVKTRTMAALCNMLKLHGLR